MTKASERPGDAATGGIDHDELRRQFRSFVNDEAIFRRFIECCTTKDRRSGWLTFWQEALWKKFVLQSPQPMVLDEAAILEAFYLCHVHLKNLHPVEIPIRKGLWDVLYTSEYNARITREAPFSQSFCLDSPAWDEATHITVDGCDECFAEQMRIDQE